MATVASAKLSRTRERAAGMRMYTNTLREMIRRQEAYAAVRGIDMAGLSPFLAERPSPQRALLLHISGDRGMCGGYNLSINRLATDTIANLKGRGLEVDVCAKGSKGARYISKKGDAPVVESSEWPRAGVVAEEVDALFEWLSARYLDGVYDEVWCTYTRFFTPLRRTPTALRLLPLASEDTQAARAEAERIRWFYEPAFEPVMREILGMFLRLQIEDVLLESFASEQGARMINMEEATERAGKMLQELRVTANRLRRESITSDLLGVLFASKLRGREADVGRGRSHESPSE